MLRAVFVGAPLLLVLAAQAAPGASACASIVSATAAAYDAQSIARAAALLPTPMASRVADEVGRTNVDGALRSLRAATALACPSALRTTEVSALVALRDSDERFTGLRVDESVADRLLERLWAFVEKLLESEAMQRFSEHTRTVYLSLLAGVLALVGFRVWRGQSRGAALAVGADSARVTRERRDAYDRCHSDAVNAVDVDPRRALLLARRALLARVGEVDHGAYKPSRTSTELLQAVVARLRPHIEPALAAFDDAFYGKDADAADARAVIAAVEAAHRALSEARA